jgi:hypothetical protein
LSLVASFSACILCAPVICMTRMKFRVKRPHLKVEQTKSAFADGNGRWTNKDLDPVPPDERKWGVISLIAVSIPQQDLHRCSRGPVLDFRCIQRGDVAIRQLHHCCRLDMARVTRHRRLGLFPRQHSYCTEWCRRRHSPHVLSSQLTRILGLLGLVYRHHLSCYSCHFLVRDSDHERCKHRASHAWRHLAVLFDAQEYDPGRPRWVRHRTVSIRD